MDSFKFKQFEVDQSGCAMKINTDGVLLGALTKADSPVSILDIGTGTGVIALMLAQRFTKASIDAVEIDDGAAATAEKNFRNSAYRDRLKIYNTGFADHFKKYPGKKYDLIVSNPPFYINSLEASGRQMNVAKHADEQFFERLINCVAAQLLLQGTCWLILPLQTSALVKTLALEKGLHLQHVTSVCSFADSAPHREIIVIGPIQTSRIKAKFTIYDAPKVYSEAFRQLLKDYFIVF